MSTQVSTRIDEASKLQFESICKRIGLSPSSALSICIQGVINYNGIPFQLTAPMAETAPHPNAELREAVADARQGRNLHGPFATVDQAMQAMLED
jgi:DNA-damage-inducible protein J